METSLVVLMALADVLLMIIAFRLGAVVDRLTPEQGGTAADAGGE